MASDHDLLRTWTAAYVLGALSPRDRAELESHAAGCDICRADIAALAPLPSMLARLGPEDLVAGGETSVRDAIAGRARRQVEGLRRSRRRWRLMAAAGVVAAVALLGWIVGSGGGADGDDDGSTEAAAGWVDAPVQQSSATDATLGTVAKGWGTEIHLAATGLPARERYQLWVVDDAGVWHLAATWGPTPSGDVRLTGATAVPVESLDRLYVTSPTRSDVLVEASA